MFLSGYHGTSIDNANSILDEHSFNLSTSDTDWLGQGIYFYFDISDAYNWRDSDAILHSVIKIDDSEFLDIDTTEGKKIYRDAVDCIAKIHNQPVSSRAVSAEKNQCAVMRMLWDSCPELKVVAASFPTERTKYRTMIETRLFRKEFCVKDNSFIKHTYLIRKDDLDD